MSQFLVNIQNEQSHFSYYIVSLWTRWSMARIVRQGKLFQKCTHLLYCSVLSLGGNVNTWRMSKPEMGSIFHIKNRWNILVIGKYYVNYQNFQNLMLLTSSDTKRTLMHLFLFTNSAQREPFLALHSWSMGNIYEPGSTFKGFHRAITIIIGS